MLKKRLVPASTLLEFRYVDVDIWDMICLVGRREGFAPQRYNDQNVKEYQNMYHRTRFCLSLKVADCVASTEKATGGR